MSEKSQELLLGGSVEPPDRLDEDEDRSGLDRLQRRLSDRFG